MKLSDFSMVAGLMNSLSTLRSERATVAFHNDHGALGVTIRGQYQNSDVVEAVRPTVLKIIDQRIADVESRLHALGVEIDNAMEEDIRATVGASIELPICLPDE